MFSKICCMYSDITASTRLKKKNSTEICSDSDAHPDATGLVRQPVTHHANALWITVMKLMPTDTIDTSRNGLGESDKVSSTAR